MRIVHLCLAVLLAGWSTPAATQPSTGATEAERVVQAFHDAFNRQELAGVLAVLALVYHGDPCKKEYAERVEYRV